jgi:hypothetical protein
MPLYALRTPTPETAGQADTPCHTGQENLAQFDMDEGFFSSEFRMNARIFESKFLI